MKKYLTLILLLCGLIAFSQEKETFYVFNANWKPTVIDSAHFLLVIHQTEDKNWQWDYYNFLGPMIRSETYNTADAGLLNGRTCYYSEAGNLDSLGSYELGKKEGPFYKMATYPNDSIVWIKRYRYHQDSLIGITDLRADSNEQKELSKDTINNKESDYVGGLKAWQRFLGKSLQYPDRAMNNGIQGMVKVFFDVDKDGRVEDPFLEKSREYSLDKESIRIIRKSGKWTPGKKRGEIVKTAKVQPIGFRLE
jgi:periplasmic protein TonB